MSGEPIDQPAGKDALLSRVTLGYAIGVLAPLVNPTLKLCCDTDLAALEPLIWSAFGIGGYIVAMIGRARARQPITSIAGVQIKS